MINYNDVINSFKKDFDRVISYSQNIDSPKTTLLLKEWFFAKKDFIKAFGDKLIYEFPEPISFKLNDEIKTKIVDDFISQICYDKFHNHELADFVHKNTKGFFKNQVIYSNNIIPKGMKLLKAFKFFEKDKEKLSELQSIASMYIQKDKIEGTFCLSVHPLDFLSASENTHNWRSCHSLDGDFRVGNLSYMIDSSTIICYLKSKDNIKLPNFPEDVLWNNKKWRMWLFFSDNKDMLFAGRQYPFFTKIALDLITKKILKDKHLFLSHKWSEWSNHTINKWENNIELNDKYLPVGSKLIEMDELIKDAPGALHYNDLLYSNYYEPYYCYEELDSDLWYMPKHTIVTKMTSRFKLGGRIKCLWCGNEKITDSNSMMCWDCQLKHGTELTDEICECAVCGNRVPTEDATWLEYNGDWICPDCAETEIGYCSSCREYYYLKDMIWDENSQEYICKNCGEIENGS